MGKARASRVARSLAAGLLASLGFAAAAAAEPAAWRVTGENGGEIALLGSMHVLRAADYPLPASVDALFERADALVMELDLDDVDAVRQQATIMSAATLADGKALRDVVDPRVYELAAERTRAIGLDIGLLERFEPWFLAITLLDLGMRQIGFTPERGIEQYLAGKAASAGKSIVGLETLELQIGIFDALPPRDQQSMLEQTLSELDGAADAMTAMAAAWRDGRLDTLSRQLQADFAEFPGLYETLVTRRNAAWVRELEPLLRDGKRYLVVVGALHLVGQDNLIGMLEARGHEVVRLD